MELVYLITLFILGTLCGSFFTVVGLRLPLGENFITNRSHCDSCNHKLSLLDMIPILSFLFLGRKCRYCHKPISSLSTYMEFFTGILFALAFYVFGFHIQLLIALGIVAMLVIIAVSDITYMIIPDELLIFFGFYFAILQFIHLGFRNGMLMICSGLFLFLLMYFIMVIGNKLFKKESLGGGDIKMMFVFGILLEPLLGTTAIFLGSILALPISIVLLKKKIGNIVPFGPFLLIALTFIYFTGITTTDIITFLKVL